MDIDSGLLLLLALLSFMAMARDEFRDESPYQSDPERTAYLVALRILKDPDVAKDIVCDLKTKILERDFTPRNPQVYMSIAARNEANRYLRNQRKFISIDETDLYSDSDIEGEYIAREYIRRANRAFRSLPSHQREELYLRFCMGSSYDEISKTLNISPAAAKARVRRAVLALKDKL